MTFQELCSNGDLRNHLKSFDFVKSMSQVIMAMTGKLVDELNKNVIIIMFQGVKNKEKFEKVPKFPRLVSWCMDIIRGDHAGGGWLT